MMAISTDCRLTFLLSEFLFSRNASSVLSSVARSMTLYCPTFTFFLLFAASRDLYRWWHHFSQKNLLRRRLSLVNSRAKINFIVVEAIRHLMHLFALVFSSYGWLQCHEKREKQNNNEKQPRHVPFFIGRRGIWKEKFYQIVLSLSLAFRFRCQFLKAI